MDAAIISRSEKTFKIEIEVPYSRHMLDGEENLQKSLNAAGVLGTKELLGQFDTDGSPIQVGPIKLTARKEKESKEFQTPYGAVKVERFVYQSGEGVKTYVPLDVASRIICTSTPKFAKMVSSKYSGDGAPGVQRDLEENHGYSRISRPNWQ